MRSVLFCAAIAAIVVACSSPASDSVETPTTNETTPPPSGPVSTTPSTPNPNPKPDPNPTKTPSTIDPIQAADCDAFGNAYCAKVWSCNLSMKNLLVDQAWCSARFSGWCKARVTAPASGLTHAALTACAAGIGSGSCDAMQSESPPPGCAFKGQLAVNAKCSLDEQCASGRCSMTGSACGVCVAKNALGGACTMDSECDYGLYCNASQKCAAKLTVGQACSDDDPCGFQSSCVGGTCVAKANVGEACDSGTSPTPSAPACMDGLGTQCSSTTKKCEAVTFAKLGETCGPIVNGPYVQCGGGTVCTSVNGKSTCQPVVALGGACTKNAQCGLAAHCNSGVCAFDSASNCN